MKFAVRGLLILVCTVLVFFTFLKPALAQSHADNPLPDTSSATQPSFNDGNLHVYSQNVLIEFSSAIICQLIGRDFTANSKGCLGLDFKTGKIGYVQNQGVVPFMEQMITVLYIPPTHTSDYFINLAANFGITKPTMAQTYANGIGFQSLTPFESIWIVFRNLAYLCFIVVFLIVGIGIMLRIRIDPRTVMTIQNMLPKVVIGLVLITFSFAIAGFLIDVMWVAIILVINILIGVPIVNPENGALTHISVATANYENPFQFVNVLGGILGIASNGGGTVQSLIYQSINPQSLSTIVHLPNDTSGGTHWNCNWWDIGCHVSTLIGMVGDFISATIGQIFNAVIGGLISLIVGAIAFLIIIIAVIWALFKIWFALIKAYIFTIADIIFAPFWVIAGLIPGSSLGFGAWLRDMLSNLAVFPIVIAMFLLADILMTAVTGVSNAYMPPLISGVSGSFGAIIALGILLSAPGVIEMAKAIFKAPNINIGPVEKAIGAGAVVLATGGRRAWPKLYYRDKDNNLRGIAGYAQVNAQKYATNVPGVVGKPVKAAAGWAGNTRVGQAAQAVTEKVTNLPPVKAAASGVSTTVNVVTTPVRKVAGGIQKGIQKLTAEPENYATNAQKARESRVSEMEEAMDRAGVSQPTSQPTPPPNPAPKKP